MGRHRHFGDMIDRMRKTHANQHDCIQAARRKVPVPQWSKAQSLCKNAAINGCLHSLKAASSEMRVPSMQQGGSSAAAPSLQPTRRLSGNDTNASVTSALRCERELMKRFSSSGMSHLSSNSPERPTRDCKRRVSLGPQRPIQFQDLISCRPLLKTTRIGDSYTGISWYVASASFRTPPPSPRPSRFLRIDSM